MNNINYKPVVKSILDNVYDSYLEANHVKNSALINKKVAHQILESDTDFVLKLDVPGYQKTDFEIKVDQNELVITSLVDQGQIPEGYKLLSSTASKGKIYKTFKLSDEVDADHIKALYENGVLKLNIPKKEKVETQRNITID